MSTQKLNNQNDCGNGLSDLERFILNISNALLGFANQPLETGHISNALNRCQGHSSIPQQNATNTNPCSPTKSNINDSYINPSVLDNVSDNFSSFHTNPETPNQSTNVSHDVHTGTSSNAQNNTPPGVNADTLSSLLNSKRKF